MSPTRIFWFLAAKLESVAKWVAILTTIGVVVERLARFFGWSVGWPLVFLKTHALHLWPWAITSSVIILAIWTWRLHRRFIVGFHDRFAGDLRSKWDFVGPWRIVERGTLLVQGSDEGGLTKVGALWENYTLTLRAKIVNECLGVIVRAQDLNNYYMFQIRRDRIRPHRRIAAPFIAEIPSNNTVDDRPPGLSQAVIRVGWLAFDDLAIPLNSSLDDWFRVRVVVRGESIWISIDGNLVFQRDSFLKIPVGKIGFRNLGNETGLVKDIRVALHA